MPGGGFEQNRLLLPALGGVSTALLQGSAAEGGGGDAFTQGSAEEKLEDRGVFPQGSEEETTGGRSQGAAKAWLVDAVWLRGSLEATGMGAQGSAEGAQEVDADSTFDFRSERHMGRCRTLELAERREKTDPQWEAQRGKDEDGGEGRSHRNGKLEKKSTRQTEGTRQEEHENKQGFI